jgi:hypothetical protein
MISSPALIHVLDGSYILFFGTPPNNHQVRIPATAFAAPWLHPTVLASKHPVLHLWSKSPASLWDESVRRLH